jgi:chromate transporter
MNYGWKQLIQLFWSFFKIAPATFGGGYAMIPLIEREVVEKKQWITSEDVSDIFALAGTVPGAVAINSSIFIGHRIAGAKGAIAAMTGVLLPTFFILWILSSLFFMFQHNTHLESALTAIRASIVALIVYAAIKISQTAILDSATLLLTIGTIVILLFFPFHPVLIIFSGGLIGIGIIKMKEMLGISIKLNNVNVSETNDGSEKKLYVS